MAYEPFSESTNKIKRNLLAVSFVGVLYGLGKILPTKDAGPLLGYKIVTDFVPYVITIIVIYLIVSLAIHVADDWLSSSRSLFWENLNDVKRKTRDRLITRFAGHLKDMMPWHDAVYGKDSDVCHQVAHTFAHSASGSGSIDFEVNVRNALRTMRERRKGRNVADPRLKAVDEFEKKELKNLLEGFESSIIAGLLPLQQRESKYLKFKNFRFLFEALLPMIVGMAAIILLWTGQTEPSPELPQEELVETDLEGRTAEDKDSGN